jgi:hypothetical protein
LCFQLNNVLIDIHFRIQIFNFLLKIVFLLSRFPFCYFRIKSFISVFESFIDLFRFKLQFSVWTFPLFPIQNFLFLISLFEIFLFICLHFISSFIYIYNFDNYMCWFKDFSHIFLFVLLFSILTAIWYLHRIYYTSPSLSRG